MSRRAPDELIGRHEAFLRREPVDRPLLGFWMGGYYPADQYPRGAARLAAAAEVRPESLSLAPFREDYEALFEAHAACDDDFFFVASAYWGIPWLEAILGCRVMAGRETCWAEPYPGEWKGPPDRPAPLDGNPWFECLLRFTRELVAFSGGRFPVCPPILRGPGDAASAMRGAMAFINDVLDTPASVQRLLEYTAGVRLSVLQRLQAEIPAWHGTHAGGGYPSRVWSRRTVAYNQDDVAALLNPTLFRDLLLPQERRMASAAEINFIHLHSTCLYPVDILLADGCYDVLEVNLDLGGPPLANLLPIFRRIQAAGVPLLFWGEISPEEWSLMRRELSPVGLAVQPILPAPAAGAMYREW